MKRFEYTTTDVFFNATDADKQLLDLLNEYGSKGWEIVSVSIVKGMSFIAGSPAPDISGTVYFKRPRE